jgi:hypothetical protein
MRTQPPPTLPSQALFLTPVPSRSSCHAQQLVSVPPGTGSVVTKLPCCGMPVTAPRTRYSV